jgi:membrane protein implicated in regulation of membrane protease activity
MPTTYGLPYFLFVALTTFQILVLRSKCKKIFLGDSEEPDKDEDFINQTATALLDFSQTPDSQHNHHGRVFFRGTEWNASSNTPINQNQRVIIERRKGSTLFVNPI